MVQRATSIDVAQYIYDRLGWIDAWQLQKLTYYAQAWSLGWYGREICDQDFEAWRDGPVEPSLRRENKRSRDGRFSFVLPNADAGRLSREQKQIIDAVLDFYGDMTREQLIAHTHKEAPWIQARKDAKPDERSSAVISKADIKRYYSRAELEGAEGPVRPFLSTEPLDNMTTAERLHAQVTRWKSALDILALR